MAEPNFASESVWTGDNLAVMRGINSECIDLIYLDPPFNSNRTYEAPIGSKAAGASFKDAWTLDDIDVHEHGELADRNPAAYSVIEAARQSHGKGMQSYLIFMAVRLLEMRRILKPSGSIYLHCDPTASHYLKLLMDGIFGRGNFQNEIVWKRYNRPKGSQHKSRRFGRSSDALLFYAMGAHTFQPIHVPLSETEIEKRFSSLDEKGRYMSGPLLRSASMGDRPNLVYEFEGYTPGPWGWRMERRKLQEVYDRGDFYFSSRGVPRRKFRPRDSAGVTIDSVWTDIDALNAHDQERLGYPTQKPLALLNRIIRASSNEGDLVLDPFCGCATALVAADRLRRKWAGIDLSALAVKLVDERIAEDRGKLPWGGCNALEKPPKRTDMGALPNYRTHRHRLYGEQEGVCAGCDTHFPFRVMDVDHMLPRSRGGTDHPDNLQLLCSGCNRSKGGKTMAEWRAARA